MKAASKTLKLIVLSIVVLLLILVVAFYFFSGYLLRVGIETAGTRALGVGVYVDDVDLSILGGTVEIDGLIVKNPPGYAYEDLLELGQGKVTAKLGSLLADTVRIKELKLDGIDLVIEQKALSNNLQDVVSSISSKKKKKAEDKERAEPSGKKLQIGELEISNIRVKVKLLPVPGKADTVMKSALGKTIDLGKTATEEGKKLLEEGRDSGKELIEGFKSLLKPKKEE